ncbi:MAG: hypothetical protein IPM52_09750 [Bacteroidetes bacterium]|nr:hypothetical protein [Bacteroidota bacterium]
MRKLLLFSFAIFLSGTTVLMAQAVGIGQWRTHLPYQHVIDVELAGNKVYAATPNDLFVYDRTDNSLRILNKVNGLNDMGVSAIRYNQEYQTLLVAYRNANIDLIRPDRIVNLNDIKIKELLGNKTINNVIFRGKHAWLACGFGIVVVDVQRSEVFDTYLIGPQGSFINVLDIEFFNNTVFAATESGVYYAPLDSPNLADFNQWSRDNRLRHPTQRYNQIEAFAGKLYLNLTRNLFDADTMFVFDGQSWDYFERSNNSLHPQMRASGDKFLLVNNYNVFVYDGQMNMIQSIYATEQLSIEPKAAVADNQGNIWVGDRRNGLLRTYNNGFSAEKLLPNGPGTTSVYELKARGQQVWVASGGRRNDWGKMYMLDGVFAFDGSRWRTYNFSNTSGFDSISDFVSVAIDPRNPAKAYIGTWQEGVIEFTSFEKTEIYSTHNSSLGAWLADPSLVNVSGLDFDSQGNLWVANTGATNLLSVRKTNGEWRSYFLGSNASGTDIGNMIVDRNNYKWILRRSDGKVIVFNDNNTLDNTADDQTRILTGSPGSGNIVGNSVFSLMVDHDGAVWVGTDKGPVVFYNTSRIFQSGQNFDGIQILVPRNDGTGQADYLLGSEKILSMAVDGANRKWFGTENGAFLLSKDGLEQVHYFNTENSPLLSNTVNSIAITDDGEVFFGTPAGIISYRGSATTPPDIISDVYAFPNPVRPEYTGPIAIKGLVRDAIVKVTDMNGNLVFQTRSLGGQALWDGRNLGGQNVQPGIYLVFVSDNSGYDTLVTKIMLMRKP